MSGPVTMWSRDTPWRQGHILTPDAIKQLGLTHPNGAEEICVMVVSHDCDLANEDLATEPNVEIIIGCHPKTIDGNFFWSKAPRKLHFEVNFGESTKIVELVTTDKCLVPKAKLAQFLPNKNYTLTGQSRSILRNWLAVRYNRASFPDEFVNRFSTSKFDKHFAKLIEPYGQNLSSVFFDIDSGRNLDHFDGSVYILSVILIFAPGVDPEKTADGLETLETSIQKLFERRYFNATTDTWSGIALNSCISISEDDISMSKARLLTEWRLESMTLKSM